MGAHKLLDRELYMQTGEGLSAWATRRGLAPADLLAAFASAARGEREESQAHAAAADLAAALGVSPGALAAWLELPAGGGDAE